MAVACGVVSAIALPACGRVDFEPSGVGWWNDAWPYRESLTIDHRQVAGDVTDFPVLVIFDDASLGAHATPDGHDLAFVDDAGDELPYERESYSAVPPSAVVWVQLPAVSAELDTTFDVYYGNAAAPEQAQPRAVWSNAYVGVYHFGDGTTLDVHDSTGNNDGTANGAVAAPDAIVGGGLALTGGPVVTAPTAGVDGVPNGLNTVTLWVDYEGPIGKAPVGFVVGPEVYDVWYEALDCVGFNTQQGDVLGTTDDLTGRWLYLAMVFSNGVPTATANELYVDGQPETLAACGTGSPLSYSVGGIVDWGGDPGFEMTGTLDEARIATGARSPAWIATEYANQHAPEAFVVAGAEEERP